MNRGLAAGRELLAKGLTDTIGCSPALASKGGGTTFGLAQKLQIVAERGC